MIEQAQKQIQKAKTQFQDKDCIYELNRLSSGSNNTSNFMITERKFERGTVYYRLKSSFQDEKQAKWFSLNEIFPTNDENSQNRELEQNNSKLKNGKNGNSSRISIGKGQRRLWNRRARFRLKLKKLINTNSAIGFDIFQSSEESSDNVDKDEDFTGVNRNAKKLKYKSIKQRRRRKMKKLFHTEYQKKMLLREIQKYKQKLRQRQVSIIDKDQFHLSKRPKFETIIQIDSNSIDFQNLFKNQSSIQPPTNYFSKIEFDPEEAGTPEKKIPKKYLNKEIVFLKNGKIKLKKKKRDDYQQIERKIKRESFITHVKISPCQKLQNQSDKSADYEHITRMYQKQSIYYYQVLLKDGKKAIYDETQFIRRYGGTARKSESSGDMEMQPQRIMQNNCQQYFTGQQVHAEQQEQGFQQRSTIKFQPFSCMFKNCSQANISRPNNAQRPFVIRKRPVVPKKEASFNRDQLVVLSSEDQASLRFL